MGDRRLVRALAATALAVTGLLPPSGVAAPTERESTKAEATGTTRIMVLGDSISHASVGDYSWRYFTWHRLQETGADVDFVGPFRDPYVAPGESWDPLYADASFDHDHASMWGDAYAWPIHDWAVAVHAYEPDVVVLELGTNDLRVGHAAPQLVLELARTRLDGIRALNPDADVVLVEVPHSDTKSFRYNALLQGLATESDSEAARVVVAHASRGYHPGRDDDSVGDTYDGIHPNTRGQVKIAAAVSDALGTLGVGGPVTRPLTFPAEGPRVVPALAGEGDDRVARLRWSVPPGATSFDVWMRGPREPWRRQVRAHPRPRHRIVGLVPCRPHEFRVRARKGWTVAGADVASQIVRLRVGPEVIERPRVRLRTTGRRAQVGWPAVDGACLYRVKAVARSASRGRVVRTATVKRPRAVVKQLPARAVVRVWVRAVGARNTGPWSRPKVRRTRG